MTEARFVMVSEWMAKGDIKEFLKIHPNKDRLMLVRFFVQDPYLCLSLTML